MANIYIDMKDVAAREGEYRKAIADKGVALDLNEMLSLYKKSTELSQKQQEFQSRKNAISAEIPKLEGSPRAEKVSESKIISEEISKLEAELAKIAPRLEELKWLLPNIPAGDVPVGKDDSENVVVRKVGKPTEFKFEPKAHWELCEQNGWADFARAPKVSGSRSVALKGALSRLEIALHAFMMDKLTAKGFTMITVPSIVKEEALYGSGHFPYSREDVYYLDKDNQYLSGTAEVVLTSLHSAEVLEEAQLPILYAGYSPCFRREAGSAGKDVRGLFRVHQFTKVEQFVICKADLEESKKWHATLLECAEELLRDLELPYQVIECCTGDMGAGKYKMNDIETWMPSEKRYRETHSCSALTDWQARRADLRYRDASGKMRHCFTLNNTGIATPRILAQFIENHQTAEGRVRLPKAIQPYMNGKEYL